MKQTRLFTAAVWTLAGNGAAALAQWATVITVSRALGYSAGGDYALALAVVNPVLMLANLQLRAVIATDAAQRYPFWDYLSLRLWTSLAAAVAVVQFGTLNPSLSVLVLLSVLALKLVEAMSDIYYGAFQQAGRMDWIAQSLITKSSLSIALLIVVAALWHSLALALLASAIGTALVWLWFDCAQAQKLGLQGIGRLLPDWPPNWASMRAITEAAFPLGVVMMLVSLNQSIPRFAVEKFAGREELGLFAAVASMAQAVNLALNALGQSMTAPLSQCAHRGDWKGFRALFGRGMGTGILVVTACCLMCVFMGPALLLAIFGKTTPEQSWMLVLQMMAAGVTALAGLCGYALTAMGEFRQQLLLFIPLTSLTALLSWGFVPAYGVEGACWVLVAGSILHLAAAGFLLNFRLAQPGTLVGEAVPEAGL